MMSDVSMVSCEDKSSSKANFGLSSNGPITQAIAVNICGVAGSGEFKLCRILLDRNQYLEVEKIALGAFQPLDGFMTEEQFYSVVESMRLPDGSVFSIPIVLDISREDARRLEGCPSVALIYRGETIGELIPESYFECNKQDLARKIYGTDDPRHPGVSTFFQEKDIFVGGKVLLNKRADLDISEFELTPEQTKKIFRERGWQTVASFHTRNVPHRAHEFLQRIALDFCDGLFIQPLLGKKRTGDFTPCAIMAGYRALGSEFYPQDRVVLGSLTTMGRYAGPREAVFHALVRRNYGATHIVIGRDHAGVDDWYNRYDSQKLCCSLEADLGIKILALQCPHYCKNCDGIVTEKTCPHAETAPEAVMEVSGTIVRDYIRRGEAVPDYLVRSQVIGALEGLETFVD